LLYDKSCEDNYSVGLVRFTTLLHSQQEFCSIIGHFNSFVVFYIEISCFFKQCDLHLQQSNNFVWNHHTRRCKSPVACKWMGWEFNL